MAADLNFNIVVEIAQKAVVLFLFASSLLTKYGP